MRKLFIIAASIAALAIPTVAFASVSVDASGNGFVGKGDVQTALGYKTDGAFQADHPETAKFTIDGNATDISIDVNCQKLDGTVHEIVVPLGYYAWDETVITSTPKISGGKVTGYNLSGVVTSGPTAHTTPNASVTSCPAGETFYGWGGDTPGKWHYVPRAGSGILQVTIGNKTVALPNTPVVLPAA
jgi:hypothetical protein